MIVPAHRFAERFTGHCITCIKFFRGLQQCPVFKFKIFNIHIPS